MQNSFAFPNSPYTYPLADLGFGWESARDSYHA